MLDNDGYNHFISSGNWKLTKGSLVVARGRLCCSLYKTQVKVCGGQLNPVDYGTSPDLWHKQLAHMSEKGLQLLAKQSLIHMAKDKSANPCDYCLFRKQHKVSFQRTPLKNWRNLVYYDVCGPMEVDSLGGNKYFVTFINDASRKTWVYLLHTKRQVFQYFHKFHVILERETGNPLKRLRTDNGGECISREFKEYFSKHGIMHEKTVPSISQHNSVAEKMNQTIVEKV